MKSIRRFAGYGPWAIAAALALDISYPVQAAPPTAPKPVSVSMVSSTFAEDPDAAANVAMAWLADPALFLSSLSTRATAKGTELHGFVANEPAHQKAVAIARAVCSGQVIDYIKIQHGMPIQLSHGGAPDELANAASATLAATLGDKVLGLRVVCPSAGRVEVSGRLASIEEKLLVSKCMKLQAGCTHVVNKISAPGSSDNATIVTNVPLMMSKPGKDGGNWKPANDANMPMIASRAMPAIGKPIEMSAPSTRMVVTPSAKINSDSKMVVVPPSASTKPGYSQVSDIKPVTAPSATHEMAKVPEPSWPAMPAAPIEITKTNGTGIVAAPSDSKTEATKSQVLTLLPESSKSADETKVPEAAKSMSKSASDIPEMPKPIIVPPLMPPTPQMSTPLQVSKALPEPTIPATKSQSMVQSPYGGTVRTFTGNAAKPAVAELPKPAELPHPTEMPQPVVEIPTMKTGKASVTDISKAEVPEAAATAKAEKVTSCEGSICVKAAVDATKCDKPAVCENPHCESAKCSDVAKIEAEPMPKLEMPMPIAVEMPKSIAVEMTKPVAVAEAPKSAIDKVERFASTPAVAATPVKPVTFSSETTSKKEAGGITLDSETARRAVEDICRGVGSDLKVTAGSNRQIFVGMKIASQGEWDRLYTKIKALPEVSGYTVLCNAQVENTNAKTSPTVAMVDAGAKSVTAPMMGVLRSPNNSATPSAESAKTAIENVCKGKGDDVLVRTPGGKQVAVSMKVTSAADWEVLYAQIKALPEIAGCSVIYNVSIK